MTAPVDIRAAFREHLAKSARPVAAVEPVATVRQRSQPANPCTPSALTPEMKPGIERTILRLAAFLATHLREHPLDAAACCLVVAARLVEVLEPAGVALEQLQMWAKAASEATDAMQVRGFAQARGPLVIPSEPDDELREWTWSLWVLVRETCREMPALDLCASVGPLLQIAWALAGRSRSVTPGAFTSAAAVAWTFCGAWMPPIEVERREAA